MRCLIRTVVGLACVVFIVVLLFPVFDKSKMGPTPETRKQIETWSDNWSQTFDLWEKDHQPALAAKKLIDQIKSGQVSQAAADKLPLIELDAKEYGQALGHFRDNLSSSTKQVDQTVAHDRDYVTKYYELAKKMGSKADAAIGKKLLDNMGSDSGDNSTKKPDQSH